VPGRWWPNYILQPQCQSRCPQVVSFLFMQAYRMFQGYPRGLTSISPPKGVAQMEVIQPGDKSSGWRQAYQHRQERPCGSVECLHAADSISSNPAQITGAHWDTACIDAVCQGARQYAGELSWGLIVTGSYTGSRVTHRVFDWQTVQLGHHVAINLASLPLLRFPNVDGVLSPYWPHRYALRASD
jgi:hypothetical protein